MLNFKWFTPLFLIISLVILSGCDTSSITGSDNSELTPAPTTSPKPEEKNTVMYKIIDPDGNLHKGEKTYTDPEELDLDFLKDMINQYDYGRFLMTVDLNEVSEDKDISEDMFIDDVPVYLDIDDNTLNYTIQTPDNMVYKGQTAYTDADDIDLDFIPKALEQYTSGRFNIILSINETQFGGMKKTGQTISYDANGSEDREIHDDGYYEAGVNRSYSRSNEMVHDLTTGLMWQDDSSVLSVKKQWLTDENYKMERFSDTSGDTATTYCDKLVLGGYSDWRLPSIHELQTIVNYGKNGQAMDNIFRYKSSEAYWTSTSNSGSYVRGAWTVSFSLGTLGYYDKNIDKPVRCVRDIQK